MVHAELNGGSTVGNDGSDVQAQKDLSGSKLIRLPWLGVAPPTSTLPSTLIYRPESITEKLNFSDLFVSQHPVEVELGSGDGSFLVQYARAHPELNLLGIERLLGRLRKIDRKGRRLQLANVRLLRLEASYVVEFLLPIASVKALHIYFPDPWPKRRHHHRRLLNARFAAQALRILQPEGCLYLRTDDADYFSQMTEVFQGQPGFKPIHTPAELMAITTDFERGFLARGLPVFRAAYRKCGL